MTATKRQTKAKETFTRAEVEKILARQIEACAAAIDEAGPVTTNCAREKIRKTKVVEY